MSNQKPFNECAWSPRKSLLSTIRQAWHQADMALYGIAAAERSQVSDALRALELSIFKAELDDAKACVGLDIPTTGEAQKP